MITVTSRASPVGEIFVRKRIQTGAVVYEQADCCQSEADEGGVSLSSYIHALFSLISQKRSRHVLMIGCGGGLCSRRSAMAASAALRLSPALIAPSSASNTGHSSRSQTRKVLTLSQCAA